MHKILYSEKREISPFIKKNEDLMDSEQHKNKNFFIRI